MLVMDIEILGQAGQLFSVLAVEDAVCQIAVFIDEVKESVFIQHERTILILPVHFDFDFAQSLVAVSGHVEFYFIVAQFAAAEFIGGGG